jgi:hypothetical protein
VEASEWGGDRPAAVVMVTNGHPVWWGEITDGGEWGARRGVVAAVSGGEMTSEWR